MAALKPLEIPTGRSLTIVFNALDAEPPTGVGVDVSMWAFDAQWRTTPEAEDFLEFTVDQTAAATGRVVISMTPAQTAQMAATGIYELRGKMGAEERTFARRATKSVKAVTRD